MTIQMSTKRNARAVPELPSSPVPGSKPGSAGDGEEIVGAEGTNANGTICERGFLASTIRSALIQ